MWYLSSKFVHVRAVKGKKSNDVIPKRKEQGQTEQERNKCREKCLAPRVRILETEYVQNTSPNGRHTVGA